MTLTELSYYFRKAAPFAILGVIVVLILYYGVQIVILVAQLNKPAQVEQSLPIDPVFGTIPAPVIREATNSALFTYTLDTLEGEPITPETTGRVLFLPEATATFGFREKIFVMAQTLGFNTEIVSYRLENNKTATFTDDEQRLEVDITNFNFDYEYNLLSQETERLNGARIPSQERIISTATDFLKNVGRYPAELARGKTNIIYLAFNPQTEQLTVVDGPENANMVEVDFYRADIDEIPVASPRYFNSQNYVILLFGPDDSKVIRARMQFFESSEEQTGVYPLRDGDTAWQALQEGGGYVVSAPQDTNQVSIKKMFLSYFDPDTYQPYLQPMYVFLGDNNYAAYVPALSAEYITEATASARIVTQPVVEEENVSPTIAPTPTPDVFEEDTEAGLSGTPQPSFPEDPDKSTRDTERIRDVNALGTILEQYLAENSRFPENTCTVENPCRTIRFLRRDTRDTCQATNWLGLNVCSFVNSIPVDPLNRQNSTCVSGSELKDPCLIEYRVVFSGVNYEINVRQEITTRGLQYSVTDDEGDSDEWVELSNGRKDLVTE